MQWNARAKSKLGRKRFISASTLTLLFTIKGSWGRNSSRARTRRQELMQRPWRGSAYWLAPHDVLSLLSYRIQDHQPRDGTTHSGRISLLALILQSTGVLVRAPISELLHIMKILEFLSFFFFFFFFLEKGLFFSPGGH